MLKNLFYLCVLTLSLGQFSAINKGGEANIYLFDISILVFSLYGLIYFLVKKKLKIPKYSVLFFFFSLVAGISLIRVIPNYSDFKLIISGFYIFRWISYLLSAVVVYNMLDQRIITKENVSKTFIISGLLISIAGFIQLIILPDFEVLNESLGWDPHKNRLASVFFDPNFTGCYLILILTILLDKLLDKLSKKKGKKNSDGKGTKDIKYIKDNVSKLEKISFLVILIAVVLTFSRSSWGMLGVIVLIYGIFKSRTLLLVSLIIAFSAYFAVPRIQTRLSGITDPKDSASFRIVSWKNTLDIIQDNIYFGVGFNTFRYVQKDYAFLDMDSFLSHGGSGADSSLLFVFATTGILGITLFTLGFLYPAFDSLLKPSKNIFLLAVIGGLLFESNFINSLFYPQIMFLWMMLIFNHSPLRT